MGFDSMFYEKCKERITAYMEFTITANDSYMLIMMIRDLQVNKNDIINISPAFYKMVSRNSLQALFVRSYLSRTALLADEIFRFSLLPKNLPAAEAYTCFPLIARADYRS